MLFFKSPTNIKVGSRIRDSNTGFEKRDAYSKEITKTIFITFPILHLCTTKYKLRLCYYHTLKYINL